MMRAVRLWGRTPDQKAAAGGIINAFHMHGVCLGSGRSRVYTEERRTESGGAGRAGAGARCARRRCGLVSGRERLTLR